MVLVLNKCEENRARLRRGGIAVASCPSTEQLLDAEQFLPERSHRTTSRRRPFSQTTGTNCGYEPRISFSSSRGEVLARAHHGKGSLHRSAEKGFCCVSSRSCACRIWSAPQANRHRMSSHTIDTSLSVNTHHSHISLEFWTRTVTDGLTTTVHMTNQTQVHCIADGVHIGMVIWVYDVYPNIYG